MCPKFDGINEKILSGELNRVKLDSFQKILQKNSSKKFCKIGIVALSFVFDKYYVIID